MECSDEVMQKKTFAQLKLLRKVRSDFEYAMRVFLLHENNRGLSVMQAVKKAKQFEIQKVVRRLKQAKESAQDASAITKLEASLASLRAADIERLANIAAASVDLVTAPAAAGGGEKGDVAQQLLDKRILNAKCVVDQLEAMVVALKSVREKAERYQPKTAAAERAAAVPSSPAGGDTDDDADELPTGRVTEDEEYESEEEEEEEEEEDGDEKEPDEEAVKALAKLVAAANRNTRTKGSVRDGSESSEEDSGVIGDYSDEDEDDEGDHDDVEVNSGNDGDELMVDDYDSMTGSDSDGSPKPGKIGAQEEEEQQQQQKKEQKTAKKVPKKPKNRLGQRARRMLAEQTHGNRAVHLNEKQERKEKKVEKRRGGKEERRGGGEEEEVLHPSWAARRKEKERLSISAVNPIGRKTVFDDGATVKSPPPSSGAVEKLHPSWQLKKQQAEAQRLMQPSQGKKTVFEDSE